MTALLTPPRKTTIPATPRPFAASTPPTRFRYTIQQYRQLGSTGLFNDVRTMLIDGELYVMAMPNPPHDTGLSRTQRWLFRVFGDGYYIRNQMGFDIGKDNDPGPDLAVVKGDIDDYSKTTPTSGVLVIEIADSSLSIDTGRKAELYAKAGVPDYWVLDLNGRRLIVFRDPQADGTYNQKQTLKESDSVSPLAEPGTSVRVTELLPNAE